MRIPEINTGQGAPLFNSALDGKRVVVTLSGAVNRESLQNLDPWGLAVFNHYQAHGDIIPQALVLNVATTTAINHPVFPALIRRVSYLAANNPFDITLMCAGTPVDLIDAHHLINRPADETVRRRYRKTHSGNDITAFLAGYGTATDQTVLNGFRQYIDSLTLGKCPAHCCNKLILNCLNTYQETLMSDEAAKPNRLELLGDEFAHVPSSPFRKFPLEAFIGKVSKANCILDAGSMDLLSLNARGQLSLIMMSSGAATLSMLSQMIDGALFITAYGERMWQHSNLLTILGANRVPQSTPVCYMAAQNVPSAVEAVTRYYLPRPPFSFTVKRVRLSQTEVLEVNN